MNIPQETNDYRKGQDFCGIKPGDRVKVIAKVESYSGGWQNSWAKEMDEYVGESFIVIDVPLKYNSGIALRHPDNYYRFPYFCLEKVEKKPKVYIHGM